MKTLFAILLSISLNAFASDRQVANDLRNSAKALVSQAMNNGLLEVDGYSLQDILQKMEKPEIIFLNFQIGSRKGGFYQSDVGSINFVTISPQFLKETPLDKRGPWVLHELLGALKLPDRQYAMTAQIAAAAKLRDKNEISGLLDLNIERNKTKFTVPHVVTKSGKNNTLIIGVGGSGTSVGGGGDPTAIYIKTALLNFFNNSKNSGVTTYEGQDIKQLTKVLLDCKLELTEKYSGVMAMKYDRKFEGLRGTQSVSRPWLAVLVPRNLIYSPRAMNDILGGLVEASQNWTPNTCSNPTPERTYLIHD